MKKLIKTLLNPITLLVGYVFVKAGLGLTKTAIDYAHDYARQDSARYIEAHSSRAVLFENRESLWASSLSKITISGLYAEFGVFSGDSINYFSKKMSGKTIYGFDSFEGLFEDWTGTDAVRGTFSRGGRMPKVMPNVKLIKGWFNETLPGFLRENREQCAFLHLDADTYESTSQVLSLIGDRIVSGTILIFDEYHGFVNWRNGEYRAWQEFVNEKRFVYEYIGFAPTQAAVRIV
jgi:hypothetical protein